MPLSPPPFSALVPAPARKESERPSPIEVIEEPITPRKRDPSTTRHPQYDDFSWSATTTTSSWTAPSSGRLFDTAPFPPSHLFELCYPTVAADRELQARFVEVVDSKRNSIQLELNARYRPRISLEVVSEDEWLNPGSTFEIILSLPVLEPPMQVKDPVAVVISFTGTSSMRTSSPRPTSVHHRLFELSCPIEVVAGASWKGFVTVPISSTCLTCDTRNDILPGSCAFESVDRDGPGECETKYVVEASCDGFERATAEVFVRGAVPHIRQGWIISDDDACTIESGVIEGWRLAASPEVSSVLSLLSPSRTMRFLVLLKRFRTGLTQTGSVPCQTC